MMRLLCLMLGLMATYTIHAAIEPEPFATEEQRARYMHLAEELRCPKCQNQNIADSDAAVASDLRRELRRMVEEGSDDQTIIRHMVDRYGEFITYRPPFSGKTLLLWLLPLLLLLVMVVVIMLVQARSRRLGATGKLAREEEQRLAQLLEEES